MKTISVVAAIIQRHSTGSGTEIFATQRGYGEWKGWWEFPGGKIEEGETPEEALHREILEELLTEIRVGKLLTTIEYDYPKFHLSMRCYMCTVISGKLQLLEHEDAKWLSKEDLHTVKWLPADEAVIKQLCRFAIGVRHLLKKTPHLGCDARMGSVVAVND